MFGGRPKSCPECGLPLLNHIGENAWVNCMSVLIDKLDGSIPNRLDERIIEVKRVIKITTDCLTNDDFQYKEEAKKGNLFWSGVLKELEKIKTGDNNEV